MKATINKIKNNLSTGCLFVLALLFAGNMAQAQNPGGVTGHNLWYKADGGVTTSGALVSQWNNQSSSNFNQLQATSGNRPTFNSTTSLFNFNPTLGFTGNDYMKSIFESSNIASTSNSSFSVQNSSSNSGYRDIYSATSSFSNVYEYRLTPSNSLEYGQHFGSFTSFISPNGSLALNTQYLSSTIYTPGSANIYSSGTSIAAASTTLTSPTNITQIGVGVRVSSSGAYATDFFYTGNIGEIIRFNTNLNTTQRQQVESYLAIKYGHTLPYNYLASDGTTTTYTVAGYANNIAGIGRDDNTALLQKQSKSVNTGSQVVMALGTAATTNLLNAGTIPTDKQFFVWGNDTGSATTTSTITGLGTVTLRLTRVWKTQNTNGFDQQITVYYPVSSFTAFGTTPYLIYATTAALLNTGATAIANSGTVSINGVSNYAFTVPASRLGNMNFFSFGITNVPLPTQRTHVLVNPSTINSSQQNGRVK